MKTLKSIVAAILIAISFSSCKKEEIKPINISSQGAVVAVHFDEFNAVGSLDMKNLSTGNIENFSMYYIDEYDGEKYGLEGPPQEFLDFCHSIKVGDVYTMRLYSPGNESNVFFNW